jgi:hypothetical protein
MFATMNEVDALSDVPHGRTLDISLPTLLTK